MTSCALAGRDIAQGRAFDPAEILGKRAAGVKAASWWHARWAGHITFKDDALPLDVRVRLGGGRQQRLSVRMLRRRIDLLLASDLDDAPEIHHHNPVGD